MDKRESKQKFFQIIEKYKNDTLAIDDVKLLTEIIVKYNPYLKSNYNVGLEYEVLTEDNNKTAAFYTNSENKIVINLNYVNNLLLPTNSKTKVSLVDYLNTIFHELRHYNQFNNKALLEDDWDKENIEKIIQSLKKSYSEENKYPKDFVSNFVNLFQEGFKGEFSNNLTDEKNITYIIDEIMESFYLRDACEYDARQAAIKITRSFIRDVYTDKSSPSYVADWCKSDAVYLKEIEDRESINNTVSDKLNNQFHNLSLEPKYIKEIIKKIGQKTSELETIAEKTKTQQALDERDDFQYTCKQCLQHLLKNKTLDELVNFYIVALVNPCFYSISIYNEKVSLNELNDDIVIKTLQSNINKKLSECSPEKHAEISNKILRVAKLPIVMTSLTESHISLNLLTEEDKKTLFVKSVCSYIINPSFTAGHEHFDKILDSFNPSDNQDCKHVETILNFYKQNFTKPFTQADSAETKKINLEKINILKHLSNKLKLINLMNKFGKAQEFEQIFADEYKLTPSEYFEIKIETPKISQYKLNSSIYGKNYAKILQAKEKVVKLSEYDTTKNFIENSENTPVTL